LDKRRHAGSDLARPSPTGTGRIAADAARHAERTPSARAVAAPALYRGVLAARAVARD
jgi:hypothetical protein